MMFLVLPVLALFLHTTSAQTPNTTSLEIPSSLTSSFDPDVSLIVSFAGTEIADGARISRVNATTTPTFALGDSSGINVSARYVIACIDPDAPGNLSQVLHYLDSNVRPTGSGTSLGSTNPAPLLAWAPPNPPQGSGPHRYIFLLFRQIPREAFAPKAVPGVRQRTGFDIERWRTTNGLREPVAGSFFVAEFGDPASTKANGTSTGSGPSSTTPTATGSTTATATTTTGTGAATTSSSSAGRIGGSVAVVGVVAVAAVGWV